MPCDVSLSGPCAVVSGRGEAEGTSRGLCHALPFLAPHCSVPYIPFPVPHKEGAQHGMRSSIISLADSPAWMHRVSVMTVIIKCPLYHL